MRALVPALLAALAFAAAANARAWHPSTAWLAQARCVHLHEGSWTANTGNGYFGGMQFSPLAWKRVAGAAQRAFAHPGDPAFPFAASQHEQLYRAWLLWRLDGKTWRSWGAVGAACAQATASQ